MGAVPLGEEQEAWEQYLARYWRQLSERVSWPFMIVVVVPTLVTAIYMYLIAAPIYVSEAHFVVRSHSEAGPSPVGAVLAGMGMDFGGGGTSSYEVDEYMMSRDALSKLVERHDLRAIIDRPEGDFLSRFPRIFERDTFENLFLSYPRFVNVEYFSTTGINTLRVMTFRPEDSKKIVTALLDEGEKLVNQLNQRAMKDLIDQAEAEVSEAQERAAATQIALMNFRTREKLIDPTRASAAGTDLVNQIDSQVIALEAQRSSLAALAPESPNLPGLDQKIQALQLQRQRENEQVAGQSDSLAAKIGEYERLMLDRDYAARSLSNADAVLEQARLDARKKQIYLERIVEPDTPDEAELPERFKAVATVFLSALLVYAIITLVAAGLREHRQA